MVRSLLYSSTYWSIGRPKFPLTEGHFVLRLNDPIIAFGPKSAAGLLGCYGALRQALSALRGAQGACSYLALNWQPVGDAVGEPLAETSTPTVHVFFHWPDSAKASSVLCVPAYERKAVTQTSDLDSALRLHFAASAAVPPASDASPLAQADEATSAPAMSAGAAFCLTPASSSRDSLPGQWTATPVVPTPYLDALEPTAILDLAHSIEALGAHSLAPVRGSAGTAITIWVVDSWADTEQNSPVFNIFTRLHSDPHQHVAHFVSGGGLDLPQ
ncbi:hypothetical protein [Arthrobacter cryoconiti]|uniref:Uncharacterized protein n=1 Tax=Arthrobacter cryoconiti TaxID=748907 RepID=A0ABV8R292_9MICC|nr:hypothetical protein [Arthrobacter cryoconiti]MCC9069781.1 hypothetical protein [Arthrobacter cryoconiti]